MRRSVVFVIFFASYSLWAQQVLTLKDCQIRARETSPIFDQTLLNHSIEQLELLNLGRNNYPHLQLKGQASYQSDVFQLPIEFPGFDPPVIPKDQYQLYLQVNQNIYDGGYTRNSKSGQETQLEIQNQAVEVELFKIQEVINELFFGALVLQENQQLIKTVIEQLSQQHKIILSGVENGVLVPGAEAVLMKEILEQEKALLEIELQRKSLLEMLGSWTELELNDQTQLVLPNEPETISDLVLNRPEQTLFRLQQEKLEADKRTLGSTLVPKLLAFGQVGMGSPNRFNPFDIPLTSFYMVGLGLEWSPWDWGTVGRKKEILSLNQQLITTRQQNFEKSLNTALLSDYSEVEKLNQLIDKDREIIELQKSIVKQAFSQFSHGVISSNDYVAEVHAETRARLALTIHRVQLAKAKNNLLTRSGNFDIN